MTNDELCARLRENQKSQVAYLRMCANQIESQNLDQWAHSWQMLVPGVYANRTDEQEGAWKVHIGNTERRVYLEELLAICTGVVRAGGWPL